MSNEQIVNALVLNVLNQCIGAIAWASHKHRYQKRKDEEGTPFINHPIGVMNRLIKAGITNPDILCAAVLHDTIEDVGVTFEEIAERFNYSVACFVMEVTDDKSLPKVERKRLQVANADKKSDGAKYIKLADKLDNLEDLLTKAPKGWDDLRIAGYFEWAYHVVCQMWDVSPLLKQALIVVFKQAERKYPNFLDFSDLLDVSDCAARDPERDGLLQDYYRCIEGCDAADATKK